ncbi:16754_t:CDS:1, partial [Dentiscutata erythropus]
FEETYIRRQVRQVSRNGDVTWRDPLFPSSFWSVHKNNEYDFPQTNNFVEAWHSRWKTLIGSSNLNIFKFIKEIQKEQNRVQLDITAILRRTPRPFQEKLNTVRESRIITVLDNHNSRPLMIFLEGIAHNLSL